MLCQHSQSCYQSDSLLSALSVSHRTSAFIDGSSRIRFIRNIDKKVYSACICCSIWSVGSLLDVSPDATDIRVTVWLGWYRKFRFFSSWKECEK